MQEVSSEIKNSLGNPATSQALGLYCAQMEELKSRIGVAAQIVNGKIKFEKEYLEIEFASLQLRRILELIAFSSLIANKEQYSSVHEKFYTHSSASRILKDIEKINSYFYPVPVKLSANEDGKTYKMEVLKNSLPGEGNPLTRHEFADLYDICSKILHTRNPFNQGSDVINFKHTLDGWLRKMGALLSSHCIHLTDGSVWLILMQADNGKARGYGLSPAGEKAA